MSVIKLLESIRLQGTNSLYASIFPDGTEVVFRLPPFKEAARLAFILSLVHEQDLQYLIQNQIFSNYVIDDYLAKHDNDIPAGVVSSIANVILYLSGINDSADFIEQQIDLARDNIDFYSSMKSWILTAFNGYTIESLDKLNYQELLDLFALAEHSLLQRGIIQEGLSLSRSKEETVPLGKQITEDASAFKQFEHESAPPRRNSAELERQSRLREQAFYEKMRRQRGG
jgi:hypothetical protein